MTDYVVRDLNLRIWKCPREKGEDTGGLLCSHPATIRRTFAMLPDANHREYLKIFNSFLNENGKIQISRPPRWMPMKVSDNFDVIKGSGRSLKYCFSKSATSKVCRASNAGRSAKSKNPFIYSVLGR